MDGNNIALFDRKPFYLVLRSVYHQMDIERERGYFVKITAVIRTEREIRDERAVHNIDMKTGDAVFFENSAICACVVRIYTHHGRIKPVHLFLL